MIVTEEVAKTKWCPFIRITAAQITEGHVVTTNRGEILNYNNINNTLCIASKCIAWEYNIDKEIGTGYCTLCQKK